MSRLVAAILALLAGGCATYGSTWSEISGERYYNVTTLHRRAAIDTDAKDICAAVVATV